MATDERLAQARTLPVDRVVSDSVQARDLVDLRQFRLTRRSTVQINLSGIKRGANVDVQLFRPRSPGALSRIRNRDFASLTPTQRNQFLQVLGNSSRPSNRSELIIRTLNPGLYYVSVRYRSGSGSVNYRLSLRTPPDRGGDSVSTATRTTPDLTNFGNRVISGSVDDGDPNDFYRFTLPENDTFSEGAALNLSLTGLTANANVQIRNANNRILRSSVQSGVRNETIRLQPIRPGTYFIRVFQAGRGQNTNYRLTYSISPLDRAGNTAATARDITENLVGTSITEPYTGIRREGIGGTDAFDFYKFTVPEGGSLTSVTINPSRNFTNNRPSIDAVLFRQTSTGQLVQNFQGTARRARLVNGETISDGFGGTLRPGTYFLRISSINPNESLLYDLSIYTEPRNNNPSIARDIFLGTRSSNPDQRGLVVVGDSLYFVATDDTGTTLWQADGRDRDQLGFLSSVKKVDLGRNLIFEANTNLTAGQDFLYFVARENRENAPDTSSLWRTDGQGVEQVLSLEQADRSIAIENPGVNVNGTLYFVGTERTAGTGGGTVTRSVLYAADANGARAVALPSGVDFFRSITNLTAIGDTLYFSGQDNRVLEDTAIGQEVWRITPGSGLQSIDVLPGAEASAPRNFFSFNNEVYFVATEQTEIDGIEESVDRLWRLPANSTQAIRLDSAAGSNRLSTENPFITSPNFTIYRGQLYFTAIGTSNGATVEGNIGRELWRVNNNSIELVADLKPNDTSDSSSDPLNLTVVGEGDAAVLYFTADNRTSGRELWRYTGTGSPTEINLNENPIPGGTAGSDPANLIALNGDLYFTADAPNPETGAAIGTELWRISADNSTPQVFDILPGQGSSNPAGLTTLLGRLFFSANNGGFVPVGQRGTVGNGEELWVIG